MAPAWLACLVGCSPPAGVQQPRCVAQEEGGSKQVIPLAAKLLSIEQSIPSVAADSTTQEEWEDWE